MQFEIHFIPYYIFFLIFLYKTLFISKKNIYIYNIDSHLKCLLEEHRDHLCTNDLLSSRKTVLIKIYIYIYIYVYVDIFPMSCLASFLGSGQYLILGILATRLISIPASSPLLCILTSRW